MKTILTAAAIAALGISSAFAADLPTKAPPMVSPAFNWTGFYVGANVGGMWGTSDRSSIANPIFWTPGNQAFLNTAMPQRLKGSGAVGGLQAGYNWQTGPAVFGIEADIDATGLKANYDSGIQPGIAGLGSYQVTYSVKTDWLATLRGRVGWSVQNTLLYATGGAAWTQIKQTGHAEFISNCGGGPACTTNAASSTTRTGWVVGAGLEQRITGNWSVKVEYLHLDFGHTSANLPDLGGFANSGFTQNINLREDIGRVGVNYKFGGPVVAKY